MNHITRISNAIARSSRALRPALTALAFVLLAQSAVAADMDDSLLRGSFAPQSFTPSYAKWDGVYFGGQLGWSSGTADYSNTLSPLTGFILRESIFENTVPNWPTMGRESVTHFNYGAFIGYNFYQLDQLVLGIEANYNRLDLDSSMQDSISRIINDDSQAPSGHHYYYHLTVSGAGAVHITDIATLRARAGWTAGQFLPYAFGGLAIGRANYYRAASVSYWTEDKPDPATPPTPPSPPPDFNFPPGSDPAGTKSESQSNAIAYGFTAGVGVDVSILPNMFLRAEWEFVQFVPIHDIQVNINSARVGIGLKF